jgi:carboxymethylenebutenolidase
MADVDLSEYSKSKYGSRKLSGYLKTPDGEGPWPAVVVIHEAFGLDKNTKLHTDRLANMGYLALAVNLFSDGPKTSCLISTMIALSKGRGRAFIDIDTARNWLLERSDCTGKVGVIGFCMGGGFALLAAQMGFAVSSVNYGQVPKDIDVLAKDFCPVVASYGARDKTLKGAAAKLEAVLEDAGVANDIKEYPEANHGFLNEVPAGPTFIRPLLKVSGFGPNKEAADDAWQRIRSYFETYLN